MKRFVYLLIILILASCSQGEKYPPIPKGSAVVVLGDSLSYGTGANQGEDYPTLLAKTTGWNIINAGIPGDTTAGGLERLPELLEEHQPKLLIVELGGNDLLHQTPHSEIMTNLKNILTLAKAQGVKTILVAIPEISALKAAVGNLSDHPLYETIAQETATPLIEDVFSEVLSERDLKADQIHPNARGYGVVGSDMYKALKQLGFAG
ncbi:MAG TPA: GDSL-type esterase/lipase family protein [Methylotenera sp.]|nr:GDSL-type esterase/lipase family protein [Methylotenera sp.]HPV45657.1 GDSL-type esterase/lipase family protein [Methylotenera sp.]